VNFLSGELLLVASKESILEAKKTQAL